MEIELKENEVVEDLGINNLKMIQNKKYFCFGMDAVLLSDFAKDVNGFVMDIGSGTGILSVLLSSKSKASSILAVEKQEEMVDIISRNVLLNNLQNVEVLHTDIMDISKHLPNQTVDCIVMNPPYKAENTGIKNECEQIFTSKYETSAKLEDFVEISSKLLKPHGSFYLVIRPERVAELFYFMKVNNIEPKKIKFVYSKNNGSNAKLVLVKGVKCGKPFLEVLNPLYIYNLDNTYTDEIYKIYSMERKKDG